MFVLRKITKGGLQMNFNLGSRYNLVDDKTTPEQFANFAGHLFTEGKPDEIYAFISTENCEIIPLYKGHSNFIMTGEGATFSNETFKG
jgi:hypothetical protein